MPADADKTPPVIALTADDGSDPLDADLAKIIAEGKKADAAAEAAATQAVPTASGSAPNTSVIAPPAPQGTPQTATPAPALPPVPAFTTPTEGAVRALLIHFLDDGFTAFGTMWYRGQELEISVPGPHYEASKDIYGVSWIDELLGPAGEMKQARRFGKVLFREGPWPGDSFEDQTAALKEEARRRQPPPLPLSRPGVLR